MTHKDIYTKFMIEYDKANVTSSYPSLTEYEVATVLDKAYQALIAQKVTGNNIRRATFESDIKSIADLGPLTKTIDEALSNTNAPAPNAVICSVPEDLLYFLLATMKDAGDYYKNNGNSEKNYDRYFNEYNPVDGITTRQLPVKLVNHEAALKFFASTYNIPWVKNPVCYLENDKIIVVYDSLSLPKINGNLSVVYIKKPNTFVKDLDELHSPSIDYISYFDFKQGQPYSIRFISNESDDYTSIIGDNEGDYSFHDISLDDLNAICGCNGTYIRDNFPFSRYITEAFDEFLQNPGDTFYGRVYDGEDNYLGQVVIKMLPFTDISAKYVFECNDTVAEELISLAVAFALENVESGRLNAKLNMRGLEA